jgi:hypothetical protein
MIAGEDIERCPSCGAPFLKKFGDTLPREGRDRCPGCYRSDGTPKSREEIVSGMARYLVEALDLSPSAAGEIAAERIASLPAWQKQKR